MPRRVENGKGTPRDRQRKAAGVLTELEVGRIKKRGIERDVSAKELAGVYGVAVETIRKIWRGESWGWVEVEGGEENGLQRVSPEEAEQMQEAQNRLVEKLRREGLLSEGMVSPIPLVEEPREEESERHGREIAEKLLAAANKEREKRERLSGELEGLKGDG